MKERTLSIVKPDAIERNLIGEIIRKFEKGGLKVVAIKMVSLSKDTAKKFYAVHKDKPFYESLTDYMSSGPCVVMVLEGENAIDNVRRIMGATDPKKASEGTIRKDFGKSIEKNSIHGSDSPQTAKVEIPFFFPDLK